MISQASCSSLLFLASLFATESQAFIATSANIRNINVVGRQVYNLENAPQYGWSSVTASAFPVFMVSRDAPPADFTVIDDGDDKSGNDDFVNAAFSTGDGPKGGAEKAPPGKKLRKKAGETEKFERDSKSMKAKSPKKLPRRMDGTSWLDKNAAFTGEPDNAGENQSFRQDFQGTRVFVQGLPTQASWQDLKDHFAIAGNVVFASVSIDRQTGVSKGVGIVQFETSEMAVNAIRIMRDHPLDGNVLYVREDVQEKRAGGNQQFQSPSNGNNKRDTPPSRWECADDENSSVLSSEEKEAVVDLIKERDAARRRKNYDVSDNLRQQLKSQFGVHVDDRLKQWWVSFDGSHVPQNIQAAKGDGRWGGQKQWRQIPTTPENDMCVSADLVNGLLTQRDIARREKDFSTADALLEEARQSPDGELYLRIHDESRTWRIWTNEPPPKAVRHSEPQLGPAEQCIELVREKAPHKEDEIRALLQKFPGREYPILKKLKKSLEDS